MSEQEEIEIAEKVRKRLLGLDKEDVEFEFQGRRYIYHKGIGDAAERFELEQEVNLFKIKP